MANSISRFRRAVRLGWAALKRIAIACLLLLFGYFLAALVLSILSTRPDPPECHSEEQVFIATNGLHLEIIVPTDLLDTTWLEALDVGHAVSHVSFGWGDKAFYLETPAWRDLQVGTALRAVFLRSESAIHVSFYRAAAGSWQKVPLCPEQSEALLAYIQKSFSRDARDGLLEIEGSGYTDRDTFYEAAGSYSCIYTCNNWVNRALKKAGVKTSLWSPFDQGVLYHLRKNEVLDALPQ